MKYSAGDTFPNVTFNWLDEKYNFNKQESDKLFERKKIILIAMPGAFSPTCSMTHLPGFIDSVQLFKNKGIDEIYCVVVNDIYVARSWSDYTGSGKAGIKIITDPLSILAEELDAEFSVKGTGLLRRLQRFTMIINNRKIEKLYFEKERGVCDLTSAKFILNDLD